MKSRTDEFARRITKIEELPERLRSSYLETLNNGVCRLSTYAPPIINVPLRHRQPVAGYLLMIFDDYLIVAINQADGPVEKVRVPLADLICVELGQVLLFCWTKLVFGNDRPQEIKIPFNLVGMEMFVTAIDLIRAAIDVPLAEYSDLNPVVPDLDFKFNNVLHEWLRPKEVLLGFAFQPEVRVRRLLLLERQVLPPVLAALTNRQFLTITEEPPAASERMGRFSEIYTYCPIPKLKLAIVQADYDREEFAELRLTLGNKEARYYVRAKVTPSLAPRFMELCRATDKLIAQRHQTANEILIHN
jgi:hypothetical protein